MRRKGTLKKSEKSTASEREGLLSEKEENQKRRGRKVNRNLSVPPASTPPRKKSIERKKSIWAPVATATTFEDVPVFTICPYCSSKVVTKTQFKRGRKHWCYCCCCLPYFLDVFKDVIHVCPKCNTQIAIYNRFNFFKTRANQTPNQRSIPDALAANQQPAPINQISPVSLSTNQQPLNVKTINQQLPTTKTTSNHLHPPLSPQPSNRRSKSMTPTRTTRMKLSTTTPDLTTTTSTVNITHATPPSATLDVNNNCASKHHRKTRSTSWHHIYHNRK